MSYQTEVCHHCMRPVPRYLVSEWIVYHTSDSDYKEREIGQIASIEVIETSTGFEILYKTVKDEVFEDEVLGPFTGNAVVEVNTPIKREFISKNDLSVVKARLENLSEVALSSIKFSSEAAYKLLSEDLPLILERIGVNK